MHRVLHNAPRGEMLRGEKCITAHQPRTKRKHDDVVLNREDVEDDNVDDDDVEKILGRENCRTNAEIRSSM